MNPTPVESVAIVRVARESGIVALIDPTGPRVVRAIDVHGGLRGLDELLVGLVERGVLGGLPSGSSASLRAAESRLRDAVAAARVRLVEDRSTTVSVRYPGRMTFVTLERDAVVAALRPSIDALVAAVRDLGADAVIAGDGVAAVPGLLDALPGRLTTAGAVGIDDPEALVDSAVAEESEPAESDVESEREPEPQPEPTAGPARVVAAAAPVVATPPSAPRRAAGPIIRRAWPVAAGVVVLLGLGSTAAALGLGTVLGTPRDGGSPATIRTDQHGAAGDSGAASGSRPSPAPTSAPGTGAPTTEAPATHAKKGAPATGSGSSAEAPTGSSGSSGGTGGGAASPDTGPTSSPTSDPITPPAAPTSPPTDPTDPPADPSPSPSDSGEPTDGGLGGGLGGILDPILP